MENINLDKTAFQITLHGGNAKDLANDALVAAKKGDYEQAENLLAEADKEFNLGHEVQSKAMQKDDKDNRIVPTLLLVHAKDHLMAAKTEIKLIKELIELHKKLDK
ncbi:PTS cellobiose transporter subunit IIA [Orenia metallireducens]|jgi:PTS system cellobiose-specific IIA component|uniref:PTS cellobiose transporter subunit IIA n=1 Tax=Orenia metallireducens TaxID=1413210 RepID=A0A1C0A5K6_9FIRM|nr:PTS lactose/cellobiose transporter subunit IIA [Orenia metallireducens]OCL25425.1 PTS cellobiose transporter subunit IIA [Orenia metallireducens]